MSSLLRIVYLGLPERWLDGVIGETRSFNLAELEPGVLTATTLWTDRSDPSRPWVHPQTQGLLPMRSHHSTSTDGGWHWSAPRPIELPHPSSSTTGPLLRLADGALAQPFEHWKDYEDPSQGVPRAMLRLSHDDGATWTEDVIVAADPRNETFFWDQRLATHPDTGELVAMFWTFDRVAGRDLAIHIAWGSPDGRRWTTPQPTPLDGQHCQPISIGGARAWSRRTPTGGSRPASASSDPTISAGRGTSRVRWRSTAAVPGRRPRPKGLRRRTTGVRWARGSSAIRGASGCPTPTRSSPSSMAAPGRREAPAGRGSRFDRGLIDAIRRIRRIAHQEGRNRMRITKIESRVIGYDIAEAWGGSTPEAIHSTWYEYSFDIFHTDEGIDRLHDAERERAGRRRDRARPARAVRAPAHRRGPAGQRGAVAQAAPAEPPRVQPLGRDRRRHRCRRSGTSAARPRGCRSRCCWASRARRSRPTPPLGNIEPTPEQVFEEAKERKAQGYHAFKIQFWDGLDRDIPRFHAAREAVGDDYPIMQDAAGMYTFSQALAAGKVLGDLNYTGSRSRSPTATCSSSSA